MPRKQMTVRFIVPEDLEDIVSGLLEKRLLSAWIITAMREKRDAEPPEPR